MSPMAGVGGGLVDTFIYNRENCSKNKRTALRDSRDNT